jgi:hypothetical protein
MALIVADRVKEVTTTTGTGTYTLGGAVDGFQDFSAVTVDTDTVYYAITDDTDWEVGIGTIGGTQTTLARTTILSSSNAGSAVNWGAGTKNIFLTYPAEKAVYEDISGNVDVPNNLTVGGTVDGVDIAARDADLTTTTNTANAALPKAGGTMTGNLVLNADPTASLQAATKQYVDTIAAAGIHYHQPCRAETTANLNATYSNGSSGVGATLTNAGTQAAIVVDGVTLSATNRVMVQLQTNAAHNGVYTVTTVGSASTNWVLTRATDADSYAPSDPDALGEGDAFFITEGTVHGGELDVMTTTGVITFGTTNIVFALVSDAPIYTAGTGLSISGTEFSLVTPVSSATALATGRTIGMTGDVVWTSAAFDGSGNVTGTATIQPDSVALGTDTTGNYVATGAVSGTGLSGSSSSEGGTFTVTSNATALNTASTIVARDGSGNFAAGTVTAALSGNSTTATALATGRTIGMTGDVVWTSASFDGSGNVTGTATIQANSVALGTDTTGNYVESVANGSYLTGGGAASEGAALTLGVDATNLNTASKVVARDASGNFAAGTITAALTGNASTATTLQTARNIGGVSFNGAADINLPGVNTAGNQNTSGNAATATLAVTTSGNAGSATVLQTARTINGVSFNGSANITVADATKLPLAGGAMTGPITTNSTFDGRDVSVDGAKLDGIAAGANNYSFPYTVSAAESTSTVVQRDGAGYIFGTYFNGTGSFATTGAASGMGTFTGGNGSDTYARAFSAAAARTLLNVADGATNVTNNNQLTNGAGYVNTSDSRLTNARQCNNTFNDPTTSRNNLGLGTGNGVTFASVTAATFSGSSASCTGNAATATILQTTRTINGTSFNGSANITITAAATNVNTQLASLGVGTAASGTAGEIRATNNVTAYYSDDRLKTKLGNIEGALDLVGRLNGFYYEANQTAVDLGYEVKREVGVSAQEVEAIMPEIVAPAPIDDRYLTVRYERLAPLLIEAIKELKDKVEFLEAQLREK